MKINIKESLISKFIETKELNILIANIYNTYFNECRQNIDEFIISRHYDKNNAIYYAWLEALEIDPDDFEFAQLSKQYHLNEIKELNVDDFNSNTFLKNLKNSHQSTSKRTINLKEYSPYECFLYDSIEVKETAFFKEITKLGYFKKPFAFIKAINKSGNIIQVNPFEINVLKKELKTLEGNVLSIGLGLGYFTYLASLKNEITSITTLEKDESLIELFNENVSSFVSNTKITIINDNLLNHLKENSYDYIFINLSNDLNKGLKEYFEYKRIEKSYKGIKFVYHNEIEILALLRRYILILFEENIEGYTKKDYLNGKTFEDKLINALYTAIENQSFYARESIEKILSDDSIRMIVTKLSI